MPDGCVDILFSSRGGEPQALSVVGLMTKAKPVEIAAGQLLFGVRFRPGMASSFMPEAGQFTDRTEPLEDILPVASAKELFAQLAESSAAEKMLCVMDDFLRPLEPPDTGQKVLHQLGLSRSSVDEFSKDVGLSTRQLRRICLDRAGVSPKFLIRILKLRDAAERISQIAAAMTPPNWAEFALSCGYYDQAHFIRDFQHFTGFTPGRYLQSLAEPGS